MPKSSLKQSPLKSIPNVLAQLRYDRDGGRFFWLKSSGRAKAGDLAGTTNPQGYRTIHYMGCLYRVHRLVWFLEYGEPIPDVIDHIDQDRSNNHYLNLRAATNRQNTRNSRTKRDGLKGAVYFERDGTWKAQIRHSGTNNHIGYFPTELEAHEAYCRASLHYHGEFSSFGSNSPFLGKTLPPLTTPSDEFVDDTQWNEEAVRKEATKYNHGILFRDGSPGAYRWAARSGILYSLFNSVVWSHDVLREIAPNYRNRKHLQREMNGAYCYAHKHGLLDELFPNPQKPWTHETIREEAKKYETRNQFKHGSKGGYGYALRHKLMDELYPR